MIKKIEITYKEFIRDISKVILVFCIDYSEFKSGKEMAKEVLEKWSKLYVFV